MRIIRFARLLWLVPLWPLAVSLLATWLISAGGVAIAEDIHIPLPRPRPAETARVPFGVASMHADKAIAGPIPPSLTPPQEAYASLPDAEPAPTAEPAAPSACQLRLTGDLAVVHPLPPIIGPGDCGALDVVRLDAIVLPDHSKVAITPAATLRCAMAEAVVHWVREDVDAVLREAEAPLRSLENYDSFECRGRNRVVGAKVSEHGLANALDVKAFKLANGSEIEPTDVKVSKDLREALRRAACARFMTVLGPGSDGYHESHIHLDLAERKNGYRLCQWDVREPPEEIEEATDVPLPRPRPNLEGEAQSRDQDTAAGHKL